MDTYFWLGNHASSKGWKGGRLHFVHPSFKTPLRPIWKYRQHNVQRSPCRQACRFLQARSVSRKDTASLQASVNSKREKRRAWHISVCDGHAHERTGIWLTGWESCTQYTVRNKIDRPTSFVRGTGRRSGGDWIPEKSTKCDQNVTNAVICTTSCRRMDKQRATVKNNKWRVLIKGGC